MKIVVSVCVLSIFASAAGAPTFVDVLPTQHLFYDNQIPVYQRAKRSNYGNPYVAPCAGGPPPIPPISPGAHQYNLGPGYGAGYGAGYGVPHALPHASYGYPQYRADEQLWDDREIMNFSDMDFNMDHVPMARSGYVAPAASAVSANLAGYGGLISPPGGPAVGLFPGANVGGCNVPLLFSCSPSIVPGRIVKTGSNYNYPAAIAAPSVALPVAAPVNAYRGVDVQLQEGHLDEQAVHEKSTSPDNTHAPTKHQ